MIHISIDYTGIIPGLGRGPFTNIAISNTLYARLKAIGYPIKVLSSNRIIRNTVGRKPVNVNEGVKPENVSTAKVEVPEAKPEFKPVERTAAPKQETVEEAPVVQSTPVEEAPAEVEEKKIDVSSLDEMTKEELDAMLNEYTTDRPGRYGKPWLIKTLKSYLNA